MKACWQTIKALSTPQDFLPVWHVYCTPLGQTWSIISMYALITLGGVNHTGQWEYPHKKNKIASYRSLCATFKNQMLTQICKLKQSDQLSYHILLDELLREVKRSDGSYTVHVNHGYQSDPNLSCTLHQPYCHQPITTTIFTRTAWSAFDIQWL